MTNPFNTVAGIAGATAALGTLGTALAGNAIRGNKVDTAMSIMGLNLQNVVEIPERRFQWWPASLTDSIAIGWSEKTLPGASHGIMQWTANGGRTISFQLKLSREMKYEDDILINGPPTARAIPLTDIRQKQENLNIPLYLRYIRAYCYPEYNGGIAEPPVVAVVNIPGSEISEDGDDFFFGVMTNCDVNYLKAFPNGKPRLVDVSVSFRQVVQGPGGIKWKSRSDLLGKDISKRNIDFSPQALSLPTYTTALGKVRLP